MCGDPSGWIVWPVVPPTKLDISSPRSRLALGGEGLCKATAGRIDKSDSRPERGNAELVVLASPVPVTAVDGRCKVPVPA